jgi:hypothetical protein
MSFYTTLKNGFTFSDANHNITSHEYCLIINEIQHELNILYNTNTINVVCDSAVEGGFEIKDSRWLNGYKTFRHHFQEFNKRKIKGLNNFKCDNDRRKLYTYFYKEHLFNDYTILHYFHYDITLDDKYSIDELERMTPLQKNKAIMKIIQINERENKKLRHWTFLKSKGDSPKWTNDELQIIAQIFNNHGIRTSKLPRL